jgi:hypothetical protein
MKQMWQPVQVIAIKEENNRTILQVAITAPKEEILKYSLGKEIKGELRFEDYRLITAEQRKKIFSTIKDFSIYTGYDAEYARQLLTLAFCYEMGIEPFSLSNCSLEVAREFINYLIEFCIDNEIPLAETAIERTDDINKYLYMCVKKSICCCCGKQGVVYRLNDSKKISLCNTHYNEAKIKGLKDFEKLYKVYGIKINE